MYNNDINNTNNKEFTIDLSVFLKILQKRLKRRKAQKIPVKMLKN